MVTHWSSMAGSGLGSGTPQAPEVLTLLRKSPLAAALAVLLIAGSAWAGGFNIYEMGARATALGGAFTATADDASALFYNPAGLAFQPDGENWARLTATFGVGDKKVAVLAGEETTLGEIDIGQ